MAGSRNRTQPDCCLSAAVAGVLAAAGITAGTRLCVALSGGIDSVVLLHALAALRARVRHELVAAHVNHGLSPHASAWCAWCARLCTSLSVEFRSFEVEVDRSDPAGPEAAARSARHRALAAMRADWLVFGHHQDDQAETLLFRLLRGTGLRGAGAMTAIETGAPGRLRPLLGLRRADIFGYAEMHRLEWVEDESNADRRFTRNRLRHDVLPVLEQVLPSAVPGLARAAGHFREAGALLDELAALDHEACGGTTLDLAAALALSDARLRNLLRWQIRMTGAEAPPRARLDEAVRQLRESARQPRYVLLGPLACCAYRGRLWLEPVAEAGVEAGAVRWQGVASLRWGSGQVAFERVRGDGLNAALLERAAEVVLMPRWAGLLMRPAARRPRRSFKKLCQEAGVPAWLRARLPVLRVDGEPVWIAEVGMAPEAACPDGGAGILPVWRRA